MKNIIILSLILLGSIQIQAQSIDKSVIGSAGMVMGNASGQIQFTIGETATATLVGASSQISQGFNQGLNVAQVGRKAVSGELTELTGDQIAEDKAMDKKSGIDFTVFPNPSSDFVNISQKGNVILKMNLQVLNIKGQVLNESKIEGEETKLDFTNFESGAYLIQVRSEDGKISKTYRVIKSK